MASLLHPAPKDKWCHLVTFSLLEELYPRHLLAVILSRCRAWERRERKLSQLVMVYLLILWTLWGQGALRRACDRVLAGLRLSRDEPGEATPTGGALCYRRQQLGARVLRQVFRQVCQPFATVQTPGGFAFGLRLMALDGSRIAVADTPKNRQAFRRPDESSGATGSPFPQLVAALWVEVGTHAIVDAIPARPTVAESTLAWGLVRRLESGMLLLQERGLFSAAFVQAVQQRGAQLLGRLSSRMLLTAGQPLPDGSVLMTLLPKQYAGLRAPLKLRVISYRLRPSAAHQLEQVTPSHSQHGVGTTNPQVNKIHRLVTTLLDPERYPALELIELYHQRWEIELVLDELKEHQRVALTPLSSKSLPMVWQEFYALLLGHYALRVLMARAATEAQVDPDRISFTHALHQVRDAIVLAPTLPASQQAQLSGQLVSALARRDWQVPGRRMRFNSRVVKRSRHRFQIKRPEHVFVRAKDLSCWQEQAAPCFAHLVTLLICLNGSGRRRQFLLCECEDELSDAVA
jgi:hypothetical protein